jgi:uncharacterized damage-inducible protein DinB
MRDEHKALREQLLFLLRGGGAHLDFEMVVAKIPAKLRGVRPPGLNQTAWRLVEHMRIAQWDILDFCRNPRYVELDFPSGYWPSGHSPPDAKAWDHSIRAFQSDLKAVEDLAANPSTDLFAKIPHGQGQTILREVLLVADHNAYHLGQLVTLRRLLGAWKGG